MNVTKRITNIELELQWRKYLFFSFNMFLWNCYGNFCYKIIKEKWDIIKYEYYRISMKSIATKIEERSLILSMNNLEIFTFTLQSTRRSYWSSFETFEVLSYIFECEIIINPRTLKKINFWESKSKMKMFEFKYSATCIKVL